MRASVFAVYDTEEPVESGTTPDLLGQLLFEYVPKSERWVSIPSEDDPAGDNWIPRWSNILEAIAEIDQFLRSAAAHNMVVPEFTMDELLAELHAFRDELQRASAWTSKFHLCAY